MMHDTLLSKLFFKTFTDTFQIFHRVPIFQRQKVKEGECLLQLTVMFLFGVLAFLFNQLTYLPSSASVAAADRLRVWSAVLSLSPKKQNKKFRSSVSKSSNDNCCENKTRAQAKESQLTKKELGLFKKNTSSRWLGE
jgi:hypothetical protein